MTEPASNAEVSSPVRVAGTANVYEGTVTVWVIDQVGNRIGSGVATASCGSGCLGDFSVDVPYSVGARQQGVITVFEESAEDGARLNTVRIPVTLIPREDDPVAEAVEGVWTDEHGVPLPDGTERADNFTLVLHAFQGADHCGWTSVTFLHLAWPIGTEATRPDEARQYIRDPAGVLEGSQSVPFQAGGELPADASYTGYHRGDWQLWIAPSDADEAVYVLKGDPGARGIWERWPRTRTTIACF